MGVPSFLSPRRVPQSPAVPSALFAQKRRTVHTVRAHRKVCAEKSSLETHADQLSRRFPLCNAVNALYLFYMT